MARKINVKLIMELRDAGLSRSTIASTRHISRHSVSEVFNIADEKGIRYDDVRSLEESEVYRLFYPEKFANETMYGDPDYEHVHQELKRVGVTLKLLHEEYILSDFTKKYLTIRRLITTLQMQFDTIISIRK